nr:MAG TPA: 30S ribosomal protein S2 [Caudoviricetes sp.]
MHTGGIIVHNWKFICRAFAAVQSLRRKCFDYHRFNRIGKRGGSNCNFRWV